MTSKEFHLNEIACECIETLNEIGVPCGHIVEFTVNTRAKSRWGQCCLRPDGFHININAALCDGKHDEGLRQTIFHELIHTCPGCLNHKSEWKRWAYVVGKHTGLVIKVSNSEADKGFDPSEVVLRRRQNKYKVYCKKCGHAWLYERKTRCVQHPELFHCSCGGRLSVEYLS